MIPFVKMHGCGNDFVVLRAGDVVPGGGVTGSPEDTSHWMLPPEELARRICDRHFGIGADGLLVYAPLGTGTGPQRVRMLYWNADGSRAEMCGNGARCVVRLAYERGETDSPLVLDTDAGPRPARVVAADDEPLAVEIDMGPPRWEPGEIPARAAAPIIGSRLTLWGADLDVTAVSMGNPHAIVFLPDRAALAALEIEPVGRALAEHRLFQRGANASFVVVEDGALHVRTYERGVGPTLACGTATCAAFAAARRTERLAADTARVHVPGGTVAVHLAADGHLWLRGPAARIAEGVVDAELLR